MSINPLLLDGWNESSTWGVDHGTLYAQLTQDGVSDDDGPQVWTGPPRYVLHSAMDLATAIASATGAPLAHVVEALHRSAGPDDHPGLDLPTHSVTTEPVDVTKLRQTGGTACQRRVDV